MKPRRTRPDVKPAPESARKLSPALVPDPQSTTPKPPIKFISKAAVCEMVGKSYPTIWRWMQDSGFPRARNTGGSMSWIESDVQDWMAARPIQRLKGDADQVQRAEHARGAKQT